MKTSVVNLDGNKLKTFPADLIKLNNVVDNATDTKIPRISELVTKTQYVLNKQGFEVKIKHIDQNIPNLSGLVERTDYNRKIQRSKTRYLPLLV